MYMHDYYAVVVTHEQPQSFIFWLKNIGAGRGTIYEEQLPWD